MIIFKKTITILVTLIFFGLASLNAATTGSSKEALIPKKELKRPFYIKSSPSKQTPWWLDASGANDFSFVSDKLFLRETTDSQKIECVDFNYSLPGILIKLPSGTSLEMLQDLRFEVEENPGGCCTAESLNITITIKIGTQTYTLTISKSDKTGCDDFWEKIHAQENTTWRWTTTEIESSLFIYIIFASR